MGETKYSDPIVSRKDYFMRILILIATLLIAVPACAQDNTPAPPAEAGAPVIPMPPPLPSPEDLQSIRARAEKGDTSAQNDLGIMYYTGHGVPQDYAESAKWSKRAAEQGDPLAQNNLGLLYNSGEGVSQDYAAAAGWFRKAAEQGDTEGQVNLADMYANGKGVEQDPAEAAKWYRRAAEQGHPKAQDSLGSMHAAGKGVTRNDEEAYFWSLLAANSTFADYIKNRDVAEGKLTPSQRDAVQKRAWAWRPVTTQPKQ